jgi:hypothetical protein
MVGVIAAVIGHPVLAAWDASDPAGPIARSVQGEASRLAVASTDQPLSARWRAVRGIEPGSSIEITTFEGLVTRTFVSADASSITVLRFTLPGLTEESKKRLTQLAADTPSALVDAAAGRNQVTSTVRLENGVAFVDGQRVAAVSDLIETVSAANILVVSRSIRRGSGAAAAFGAVGGLFLGSLSAARLANSACYPSCGATEAVILASIVGIPIATGYGSWRASSRIIHEVVYP